MSGMWKQLFAEAPPGALEKLLSPKRKVMYALFAFTPGTLLGLYLHSVKKEMERDNNRLRMEKVQEQLDIEDQQQNKDLVLANSLQELRDRLQKLEAEVAASQQVNVAQNGKSTGADVQSSTKEVAAASAASPPGQAKTSTRSSVSHTAASGIGERVRERNEAMYKRDLKAYKAEQQSRAEDK